MVPHMAGVRDRHGSRDRKRFFWRAEMAMASHRRPLVSMVVVLMCMSLCSGCSGLKYHRIFMSGVAGAVIGGIVGHQSDEDEAGVAVGAALFATGDLLFQIDQLDEEKKATMVNNLMVALVSETQAQPIINRGTLYS